MVALNLSAEPVTVDDVRGEILIATARDRDGARVDGALELGPWEAAVVETNG
jgi:hypothetical protein